MNDKTKQFSDAEKTATAAKIENLFNNRPQDVASLQQLQVTLQQALASNVLTQEQKNRVQNVLLTQAAQDIVAATQAATQNTTQGATAVTPQALAQNTAGYEQNMKLLNLYVQNARANTTQATQETIGKIVQSVFDTRSRTDVDATANLSHLLQKMSPTTLVTSDMKNKIEGMIYTIQIERNKILSGK